MTVGSWVSKNPDRLEALAIFPGKTWIGLTEGEVRSEGRFPGPTLRLLQVMNGERTRGVERVDLAVDGLTDRPNRCLGPWIDKCGNSQPQGGLILDNEVAGHR